MPTHEHELGELDEVAMRRGRFGLLDAGSSCEPFHHLPVGGVSAFASVGRDRRFGIAAGQEAVLLVGEQT
ncbi:MAG TPA: hypothetical protein VHW74_09335 [Mycobacteriales bacterium]|nr:hypothetical protein [Mycobacteriales bacterium]